MGTLDDEDIRSANGLFVVDVDFPVGKVTDRELTEGGAVRFGNLFGKGGVGATAEDGDGPVVVGRSHEQGGDGRRPFGRGPLRGERGWPGGKRTKRNWR
jgi:hypothetical protein